MPQVITNYTTYDLAYFYADLKCMPRLPDAERHSTLALPTAQLPCSTGYLDDTQARHRLIEGHLRLAKYLAIELCPPAQYHRLLPDLIGAANLALVEATARDLNAIVDMTAYLAACMRGAIKRTIANDELLKIPYRVRERARQEGTIEQVYAQGRLASLDELMQWFDADEVEEPRVKPIYPMNAAPPRDPALRAQVETLLSYLSPRAQSILRLRYGLADENEHRHATAEIVRELGLDRRVILTSERDALRRLKALVAGEAKLTTRKGKLCISYTTGAGSPCKPTSEQEAALKQAFTGLREQGNVVTGRMLAKATGLGLHLVWPFLRMHREETPKEARARQREKRLEETCARLEAQDRAFGGAILARDAGVMKKTALDFLKARRSKSGATA